MSGSTASPRASRLRPAVAAAAALLMTLTGATAATASAAASSEGAAEVTAKTVTHTAPAAPASAADAEFGVTAVPTISPSTRVTYVPAGSDYPCSTGELCALAWDSSRGMFAVFHLYNCARYSVSGWVGQGYFANQQTNGTVARFYNQAGGTLWTSTAPSGHQGANWDRVWSIRNC
ncbi:hypothetical protein [Promicromonospora sp. NPDC023805]|uniref:hypothetical protein n=1 Tax=Promicromonospora sp. NPDC023805 TaxID=3154696 RepID=UPI0033D011A3